MTKLLQPLLSLAIASGALFSSASAQDPLHKQIDTLIAAKAGGAMAARSTDAEFVRRVHLDLVGRIPSTKEARTFLADSAADKREKLIDRLLASDEFPYRMRDLFHVHLMERRGDHDEWSRYLLTSFQENKSWDQLVRELLAPEAENEKTRGSAFFHSKRLEKYGQNPVDRPGLVRDVARLFLGMDVQCAQCHDHPHIDDYLQVHYQGIFAYMTNTSIRRDAEFPAITEGLLKEKVEFVSVFDTDVMFTGPQLPGGTEIEIPTFKRGEEYLVAPDRKKRTPGVPKFSPLKILAKELPTDRNVAFKQNIVNRLWFVMMGRGLVHPLDQHHSGNPPSHPALLKLLGESFAAHKFDIRWILRELALSETYQRSSLLPKGSGEVPPESYRVAIERPILAEQMLPSVMQATDKFQRPVPTEGDKKDPAADKYAELLKRFQSALAAPAKEPEREFNPSVRGALFFANDSEVQGWLQRKPGNLIDRLMQLKDPAAVGEALYLGVLTRLPTDQEQATLAEYLGRRADNREAALRNYAWALLASTEFSVNH